MTSTYDPILGIVTPDEPIADGAIVVVAVADTAGNVASLEVIADALPIEDTSLSVDLTPPPVEETPAVTEGTATATPVPGSAAAATPTLPANFASSGDDSSSGVGALTIILALVVVAAAGGGGFYAYRRWGAQLRPGG